MASLALAFGVPLVVGEIVSTLGTGVGFVTGATISGFGFAGGASAFSTVKQKIENAHQNKKGTNVEGKRDIRKGDKPFSNSRFLDHLERRELGQKLIREINHG